jgi:hypothetical protein
MEGHDVTEGARDARSSFALLSAGAYILFGGLELASALMGRGSRAMSDALGRDPVAGVVLVLVGLVLLQGRRELVRGQREGVGFVYVGIGLGLFFGAIALARLGADALGHAVIGGPDYASWSPADDLVPMLYLAALPLAGALAWRRSFTLRERGRPPAPAAPTDPATTAAPFEADADAEGACRP